MHRELEEQRGLAGLDIKEAMYEIKLRVRLSLRGFSHICASGKRRLRKTAPTQAEGATRLLTNLKLKR